MNQHDKELKHAPKVSIGMPVYNGEKFIREALNSLIAQTFTDFELIISDNASTDKTEAICCEYTASDKRIRYIRQSENRGAERNFQFVLEEAIGEYFMWAAADDIWDLKWIKTLLSHKECSENIMFGSVVIINEKGNQKHHLTNGKKYNFRGARMLRRLKFYLQPGELGKANIIYGLHKKSVLLNIGLSTFSTKAYAADILYIYDLLSVVCVNHVDDVVLFKRIHSNSQSYNFKSGGGFRRIRTFLKATFLQPMVNSYLKQSSIIESAAILLLFPIAVLNVAAYLIYDKSMRSIKN